jgi:hypothetical protein
MVKTTRKDTSADTAGESTVEDRAEVDPFSYIFQDYQQDENKVTIMRLEPAELDGVKLSGYMADLVPGVDEAYIKTRWGGGKYLIQRRQKSNGQIIATRTLEVAGLPKVKPITPPSAEGAGAPASGGFDVPLSVDVGGVEVPLRGFGDDLQRIKEVALFTKALEHIFPKPADPNAALLELVISGRNSGPNLLDQVEGLKTVMELVQAGGGGGDAAGGNFYDLMKSVIEQAGKIITSGKMPGGQPGLDPGKRLGLSPVESLGDPSNITDITGGKTGAEPSQPPESGAVSMGQRELMMMVVGQIVAAFRLQPPRSPAELVPMLDQVLQITDAGARSALHAQVGALVKGFAESELVNDWSDPEVEIGDRETFNKWLDEVFQEYTRADREVVLL